MYVFACCEGKSGIPEYSAMLCGTTPFKMTKGVCRHRSDMVRFQKQLAYTYKKKAHFKHVVLVSSRAAKELGWKPGQELKEEVMRQTLIISPKSTQETSRKARKH